MAFKKALIERALARSWATIWANQNGAERPPKSTNQHNVKSSKSALNEDGPLRVDIPCDSNGSFPTGSNGWPRRWAACFLGPY
jgi:hypothetical protein